MSDIDKVKELRKLTGAGFKDCNNALKEANSDIEKAIEILRVKGISKASKKMTREANEGVVAVFGDNKKSSLIEVNCETDFVAKNDDFISFVKEISEINNSVSSDSEKLKKSIMKHSKSVEDTLVDLISKIGEKITLGRSKTIVCEKGKIFTYLHSVVKDKLAKLAVISSINYDDENDESFLNFGKQLSMHIAASNPIAINEKLIDQNILTKEKELIAEELKNNGKPKEIVEKISKGKLNKFIQDNCLMTQSWVMDPDKKVNEIIQSLKLSNLEISAFHRIKIGE